MLYSKSQNAAFNPELKSRYESAGTWPDDFVEISDELYDQCFRNPTPGKIIQPGPDGLPMLVDPPGPTDEELEAQARAARDSLLSETVDTINAIRWASMSVSEQAAWAAYRQALLDVPEQPGFPADIDWPVAP